MSDATPPPPPGGDGDGASGAGQEPVSLRPATRAATAAPPRHDATWLTAEMKAAQAPRVLVAGDTHPDFEEAAGFGLSQLELMTQLRIPAESDTARYDAATNEYVHAAAETTYTIALPYTLDLPGGAKLVVSNTAQLCRLVTKQECRNKEAHKEVGNSALCSKCSLALDVTVVDERGEPHTLTELGYVARGQSESTELIKTLLLHHAARAGDAACLPAHFCPARPNVRKGATLPSGYNKSFKTEVCPAAAGYASGAHQGFRAYWNFACGFLGPMPMGGEGEDGLCGAPMFVGIKPDDPHRLHVVLPALPHRHAAGACAKLQLHAGGECRCVSYGLKPLSRPAGNLGGLLGATQLRRMQDALAARRAGVDTSPMVLAGMALDVAPPLAKLHRNRAYHGSQRDWENILATQRAVAMRIAGVPPCRSAEDGGPHTVDGRIVEGLTQLAAACAAKTPKHEAPPVLGVTAHPFFQGLFSTHLRLRTLVESEQLPRAQRAPLGVDLTGGLAAQGGKKYYEIAVVRALPAAAGGGRFAVLTTITESKCEMAFIHAFTQLKFGCLQYFNHVLEPALLTLDQDLAELNAIAVCFNNLPSHAAFVEVLEAKLDDVADYLYTQDMLLAPVMPSAGKARIHELLDSIKTLPLLCVGHYIKAALDHVMYGEHFKGVSLNDRHYLQRVLLGYLYPALTSALFAGVENWTFLRTFCEEVLLVLSTGPLGVILDGVVLFAHVRVGEEKDRRPGKPVPPYVFESFIRNFGAEPILRVRIYDTAADGASQDVQLPEEATKAQREALMTGLSEEAQAGAREVPTEQLQALPGYTPVEDDSAAEGADGGADAPDAPQEDADDAAPAAGGGGAGPSVPVVRNPVYYAHTIRGKVVLPLHDSFALRRASIAIAAPTLRTAFEHLKHKGNCNNLSEVHFAHRKHKDNVKADLPRDVVQSATELVASMQRGDALMLEQLASTGDLVTERAVRGVSNGRSAAAKDAAAAEAALTEAQAAGADASAAQAKGKGKGKKAKAAAAASRPERPDATFTQLAAAAPRELAVSAWGAPGSKEPASDTVSPATAAAAGATVDAPAAPPAAPCPPPTAAGALARMRGTLAQSMDALGTPVERVDERTRVPLVAGDEKAERALAAALKAEASVAAALKTLSERYARLKRLADEAEAAQYAAVVAAGAVPSGSSGGGGGSGFVSLGRQRCGKCCKCIRNLQPADEGCSIGACGACCRGCKSPRAAPCRAHARK